MASSGLHLTAGLVLVVAGAADVFPGSCNCGGPETVTMGPWRHCGWEGPRRNLVCAPPTECLQVRGMADTGSVKTGQVCTVFCAADADCAALGNGFACLPEYAHNGHYQYRSACGRPQNTASGE